MRRQHRIRFQRDWKTSKPYVFEDLASVEALQHAYMRMCKGGSNVSVNDTGTNTVINTITVGQGHGG